MSSTFSEAQHDYIHDILWDIRCRRVVEAYQDAANAFIGAGDQDGLMGLVVPQDMGRGITLNRIMTEYLTARNN